MKTTIVFDHQICQCPNQHLLMAGQVCDLCMGIVASIQDHAYETPDAVDSRFDQRYFEELEMRYDDIEFAA